MSGGLRAAAGAVDLRPRIGSRLTGFGSRLEPSQGVRDPLLARLLLLDDGATRLFWVSCELIGLCPADDLRLRKMIAARSSMPAANVLVSCTHTHSGPCSMPFRGPLGGVDGEWLEQTFAAIASEAAALPLRLRPAQVAYAMVEAPGLGYNRQDGASPIDERLLTVRFTADDGGVIASLLNCATHPVVLGEQNLLFTGDYPGYAMRAVEQSAGGVALFVLGAAGDVDPLVYRDIGRNAGTFAIAEEMGRRLADAANEALTASPQSSSKTLSVERRVVEVPHAPPPPFDEVASLHANLLSRRGPRDQPPASDDAKWAEFELAWVEELKRSLEAGGPPRRLAAEIAAARIGDLLVVAFPFEIYSQIGLDVRARLAPRDVLIAGYTNGLYGYAPTDLAIDQGGYGPAHSYRFFPGLLTPIGKGADRALVGAAVDLASSL